MWLAWLRELLQGLGPFGILALVLAAAFLADRLGGGRGISKIVRAVRGTRDDPDSLTGIEYELRRRAGTPFIIEPGPSERIEPTDEVEIVRAQLDRLEAAVNGQNGVVQQIGALRALLEKHPTTDAIREMLHQGQARLAQQVFEVARDLREHLFSEGDKRWQRKTVEPKKPE